eukprot:RCo003240
MGNRHCVQHVASGLFLDSNGNHENAVVVLTPYKNNPDQWWIIHHEHQGRQITLRADSHPNRCVVIGGNHPIIQLTSSGPPEPITMVKCPGGLVMLWSRKGLLGGPHNVIPYHPVTVEKSWETSQTTLWRVFPKGAPVVSMGCPRPPPVAFCQGGNFQGGCPVMPRSYSFPTLPAARSPLGTKDGLPLTQRIPLQTPKAFTKAIFVAVPADPTSSHGVLAAAPPSPSSSPLPQLPCCDGNHDYDCLGICTKCSTRCGSADGRGPIRRVGSAASMATARDDDLGVTYVDAARTCASSPHLCTGGAASAEPVPHTGSRRPSRSTSVPREVLREPSPGAVGNSCRITLVKSVTVSNKAPTKETFYNVNELKFTCVEGMEQTETLYFQVHVSVKNLMCRRTTFKMGFSVRTEEIKMGDYAQRPEPYSYQFPLQKVPKGFFVRGSYSSNIEFIDDQGACCPSLSYTFDIVKDKG